MCSSYRRWRKAVAKEQTRTIKGVQSSKGCVYNTIVTFRDLFEITFSSHLIKDIN
jgi:hypothetical protein